MTFPADHGPARDEATLAFIRGGNYQITWATITSSIPGHTASFRVFADALKVDGIELTTSSDARVKPGVYNGVRINATAAIEQQVADLLYCSLLTPKLADLLYVQRQVTLLPRPMPITSTTQGMILETLWLDDDIRKQGADPKAPKGIVQSVGKHWTISNELAKYGGSRAENYGWHFPKPTFDGRGWGAAVTPPWRLIQDMGWAHDPSHVDYSQNIVLVSRTCVVDGQPMDLRKLLVDPVLAPLASHQGPLTVLRQPGVQEFTPLVGAPPSGTQLISWNGGSGGGGSVPSPASSSGPGAGTLVVGVGLALTAGVLLAHALKA
jgi:hypothetical protein